MSTTSTASAQALRAAIDQAWPALQARAAQVDDEATYPTESIALLAESGLLRVGLSRRRGGLGLGVDLPYRAYFDGLVRLAAACSNTAQLFAVQNAALFAVELLGNDTLADRIAADVRDHAATFCFVGAEPNERFTHDNKRVNLQSTAEPAEGGWRIRAEKAFATGSLGCSYALFQCASGAAGTPGELAPPATTWVVLPRENAALSVLDTWDGMGQRATTSGKLIVQDTVVEPLWVLGDAATRPRAQIFAPLFQLGFASIFVGIGEAALAFAIEHVNTRLKPTSGYARAADEPSLQGHIGSLRIQLSAAAALVRHAADLMDGIERGEGTIQEVLSAVYQAKVFASQVALEASSRLFQIGGARLASRSYAADRFWRNARTLTLHDSVDKQTGIVGRHVLGIEQPSVSNR